MRGGFWRRLALQSMFVLLAVGSLCFGMAESLPGDAAYRIAAGRYGYDAVDTAAAQAVRTELGLDRGPAERWLHWLADVARGRLGESMVLGEPVTALVAHQLGHTLWLSAVAWLLALTLGLVLGLWAALRPAGLARRLIDGVATLLRASPSFLTGVVLSTLLAVEAGWLPVAGHEDAAHVVLPALTLALALVPGFVQVVRDAATRVLHGESFAFAQVKGLPAAVALRRHGLPPVLLGTLAYAGVQLVLLVEGMVVVETLFAWPGIGHALVHAVIARDVPMVQGTALTMALLFVALHAAVDALHRRLDPRLAERSDPAATADRATDAPALTPTDRSPA